jgi:hypothetical protein
LKASALWRFQTFTDQLSTLESGSGGSPNAPIGDETDIEHAALRLLCVAG